MTQKDVIENLRKEAASNPTTNAVLHMFATRKRARSVLTLQSLNRRMSREGFTYTKAQYADVLKMLSRQGIGELDVNHKGQVRGLKRIRVTFESIGLAAVGQKTSLRGTRERNTYVDLPKAPPQGATARDLKSSSSEILVSTFINGKTVTIQIPKELEPKDVADLIALFRSP